MGEEFEKNACVSIRILRQHRRYDFRVGLDRDDLTADRKIEIQQARDRGFGRQIFAVLRFAEERIEFLNLDFLLHDRLGADHVLRPSLRECGERENGDCENRLEHGELLFF
jgi:hypothetical protein